MPNHATEKAELTASHITQESMKIGLPDWHWNLLDNVFTDSVNIVFELCRDWDDGSSISNGALDKSLCKQSNLEVGSLT